MIGVVVVGLAFGSPLIISSGDGDPNMNWPSTSIERDVDQVAISSVPEIGATPESVKGLDVKGQSPRWWRCVPVAFLIAWMQLRERERQIACAVAVVAVAAVASALTDVSPPHPRRRSTSCQARGRDITPVAAAGSSPGDGGGVGATPWS